jgi:purine-nucleoside phosphorylase
MELKTTEDYLRRLGYAGPCTAIVLGTGLGRLVDAVDVEMETAYDSIPGFPEATVEFHKGRLIKGRISGHPVLVMQGRYHYYEGYSMQAITFPVRVMKALGARRLLLSNAAGCMNMEWQKGDLMLVDDHINLLPEDPLHGPNDSAQGSRFPDMSKAYASDFKDKIVQLAAELNVVLRRGIYAAVQGPNLETAAEYRMLRSLGADAVGMSTVPEVKVANHIGMPCAAISVLTDMCNPDALEPVDIQDIIATAMTSEKALVSLMLKFLENTHPS